MVDYETDKNKRYRRSNYAVDRDILDAVASLIKEVGFQESLCLLSPLQPMSTYL